MRDKAKRWIKARLHHLGGVSWFNNALPLLALIVPILISYLLEPSCFERTWHGRTYQLFFLWLLSLETVMGWKAQITPSKARPARAVAFVISLFTPTAYVIAANFLGLNAVISDCAAKFKMGHHQAKLMPLSVEYLVLAGLLALITLFKYGVSGLKGHSISSAFLAAVGGMYMVDNLCPYGRFTPFQVIAVATTALAANVLNSMGYSTSTLIKAHPDYGLIPVLTAQDPNDPSRLASFGIGWPCSGVESLIIYTVTVLLFLSGSDIPLKHKIAYFGVGAAVTYFINVLRISAIFIIEMNEGSVARQRFHDYYGQLYSIVWIISYLLIIIGIQALRTKIEGRRG